MRQGWHDDDAGLYQQRWYSQGQRTRLVRDSGVESYDEAGQLDLAQPVSEPVATQPEADPGGYLALSHPALVAVVEQPSVEDPSALAARPNEQADNPASPVVEVKRERMARRAVFWTGALILLGAIFLATSPSNTVPTAVLVGEALPGIGLMVAGHQMRRRQRRGPALALIMCCIAGGVELTHSVLSRQWLGLPGLIWYAGIALLVRRAQRARLAAPPLA